MPREKRTGLEKDGAKLGLSRIARQDPVPGTLATHQGGIAAG